MKLAVDRKPGSGRVTAENTTVVSEMICSQEDKPGTSNHLEKFHVYSSLCTVPTTVSRRCMAT